MIHCIFVCTVVTMFRRKKSPGSADAPSDDTGRAPRGRAVAAENPLARRLQPDREPATIDLAAPARFHPPPAAEEDPQTAALQTDAAKLSRMVSCDTLTGKFYVHPGGEAWPVLLQGEEVRAPTELRAGDTIRVGDFEFRFAMREL
jgi:hypothetical protein